MPQLDTDCAKHQMADVLGDQLSNRMGVCSEAVRVPERSNADSNDNLVGQVVEPVGLVELEREVTEAQDLAWVVESAVSEGTDCLHDGVCHWLLHGTMLVVHVDAWHGASFRLDDMWTDDVKHTGATSNDVAQQRYQYYNKKTAKSQYLG